MKLRGNDMMVLAYVGGEYRAIAYATACDIDMQAKMVETGSPLTGAWKRLRKRGVSWLGTTAHLMADARQEVDIMELVREGRSVMVAFGCVTRKGGQTELTDKMRLTGQAYISRANVTARRGDVVTMSATLTGAGTLATLWERWILATGRWSMTGVWMNNEKWIND